MEKENVKKEKSNISSFRYDISLAWKDKPNRNNFYVPKEVISDAINERKTNECSLLYIAIVEDRFEAFGNIPTIAPDKILGFVETIDLDKRIASVQLYTERFDLNKLLEDSVLILDYRCMSFNTSDIIKTVELIHILSAGIIPRTDSSYEEVNENE